MKLFKIFAGCLLAALVMSSVAVASASASQPPEFGKCVAKAERTGEGFKDSKCRKPGTGKNAKYEWVPGPGTNPGFTWEGKAPTSSKFKHCNQGLGDLEAAKAWREEGNITEAEKFEKDAKIEFENADKEKPGGLSKEECEAVVETEEAGIPAGLETEPVPTGKHDKSRPELRVQCEEFTASGERRTDRTEGGIVVKMTGCASRFGPCTSAGANEGEVVTSSLDGELGFVEKNHKEKAAISIEGEGDSPFAIFDCGTETADVYGSVITEVEPNRTQNDENMHFGQKKGVQQFERLIGGPEDVLHTSLDGGAAKLTGLRLFVHQINDGGEEIEIATEA